jgi:glycosyltransferase involved in cell wall biosynthesis
MKILLGVPEYPPYYIGGGGEVFKNLAENYKKLGHEVVVIYGYHPSTSFFEKIKEYEKDGIKYYQIPEIPCPKSMPFLRTALPPNLNGLLQLNKIIKKENPDVAHLHGYGLIFIDILAKTLKKNKINYIFTIHGYPETPNKKGFFVKFAWQTYQYFFTKQTLKWAKKITFVSNWLLESKKNIFEKKLVVVQNGINPIDFEQIKKINLRKKFKINKKTIIIFSMGRISEMKGFQEVIKILPSLLKKFEVKYIIAGRDEGYKRNLNQLINELNLQQKVIFNDFLDLELKKAFIFESDIFAIPSLWEPFGLVALEGMILNKPILTNECGGLKEILLDYPKKFRLDDPKLVNKIKGINNTSTNKFKLPKKYNWSEITNTYLELLK